MHIRVYATPEISLKIINLDYEHIVRTLFFQRSSLRNHSTLGNVFCHLLSSEKQHCLVYCLLIELSTAYISHFNLSPLQLSREQLVTPIQFVRGAFYLSRLRHASENARGPGIPHDKSLEEKKKKEEKREKKKGDTARRW